MGRLTGPFEDDYTPGRKTTPFSVLIFLVGFALFTLATVHGYKNFHEDRSSATAGDDAFPCTRNRPERGALHDRRTYQEKLAAIAERREELRRDLERAQNGRERADVLEISRREFTRAMFEDIMPEWLGTDWDFNGTTQTPRVGKIACGYFVSTTLLHAGLRVERIRLAREASENIIKTLTGEKHIRRFSRSPLAAFVEKLTACGDGLYVVGLDFHVGFIVVRDGRVFFVHSQGTAPRKVVLENALASPVLNDSRYRVIGKISDDDALIEKWLTGGFVPTFVRRGS